MEHVLLAVQKYAENEKIVMNSNKGLNNRRSQLMGTGPHGWTSMLVQCPVAMELKTKEGTVPILCHKALGQIARGYLSKASRVAMGIAQQLVRNNYARQI